MNSTSVFARAGRALRGVDPFKQAVPSRRRLLLAGVLAEAIRSAPAKADCPTVSSTRFLARRLTMGPTSADHEQADCLGDQAYLEYQLDYASIDDGAMGPRLAHLTTLIKQPYELVPLTGGSVRNELIEATILRAVYSKRQLFERMVEFWTDHFNIDINNGTDQWLKTIDDRDVIRANALGTFPALLSASAHSPAMLYYLDNTTSTAGNPNENYARELMELHAVGVDGGYTQQDVQEVARCFTGWSMYGSNSGTNSWKFRFNSGSHDNNPKTVLGQAIPAGGGISDGDTVLNMLATHPSTANFISRKLCKWFWGYDPPQTLIDAVASTYTNTGGDIKAMLRTLFANTDAATAPLKYKRPFHLFVSALRATVANITTSSGLRTQLTSAGHMPFYWNPPDGYPDTLDAWIGLILPRWNFGAALMNGNISGASVDLNVFLSGVADPNDAQQIVDRIDESLFGGSMPAADKSRIKSYLLPDPPDPTTLEKKEAIGLAIGSPGFQWY